MLRALLTLALISILTPSTFAATSEDEPSVLHVNGQATIMAAPDQAHVRMQINRQGSSAAELHSETDRVVQKVIAAAENLGIESRDVQAMAISAHPNLNYNAERRPPMREDAPTQVTVSRRMEVLVRDLNDYPALMEAAFEAGINQVTEVTLSLADTAEASEQALQMATEDALTQARIMAEQLKMDMGRIRDVRVRTTAASPRPLALSSQSAAFSSSHRQGEVSTTASVAMQVELVDR